MSADGRIGWHHQFVPYDAIHVGASAAEIPKPLIEQWKNGDSRGELLPGSSSSR